MFEWQACLSPSARDARLDPLRLFILLSILTLTTASCPLIGVALGAPESVAQPPQSDSLGYVSDLSRDSFPPRGYGLPFDPAKVPSLVTGRAGRARAGTAPIASASVGQELSPPFQVSYKTVSAGPAGWDQRSVAVAYGGDCYLVVWSDARNSILTPVADLYGARVSTSGEILDIAGIPICTEFGNQRWPSVSFDGTNFLVVWEDGRNYWYDIYCARVSPAGFVLDPDGVPVSTASGDQLRPTVAFDGAGYLVAWQDWRSGSPDIYGTRLNQALDVLDPAGIPICQAAGDQYFPEAAFCSGKFMVVWQDIRSGTEWDIYGTRLNTAGSVLDPAGIPILTGHSHQWAPDVGTDGTGFLVAWADGRATGSDAESDIYATRVNVNGVVQDVDGFAISSASLMQHWPAIAHNGTNYVVTWEDKRSGQCDVYAARVNGSGTVIDPSGILVCSAADEQYYPAVASDGSGYLVVWDDHRNGTDWNTFGTPLTAGGSVLEPNGVLISSVPNAHYSPGVAFDGTNYLVVWYDTQEGSSDVYAARVDTTGKVLDSSSFSVSAAPGDQVFPVVAFDGTNYLVVWEDFRSSVAWDIYGARVSTAGEVLDPTGIPICTALSHQWCPSVAFDGVNYLVVWGDARSSGTDRQADVYGARVSPTGVVLDPAGVAIGVADGMQMWPDLAFDGTNYTVVWQDTRNLDYHIFGARITPSGMLLDAAGIPISTAAAESYMPAIAFDGTNYMVVWEDNRTGVDLGIYGTRLSQAGEVLNPGGITISDAVEHQVEPSIAFDGSTFVVAWQDLRSSVYYDIYAARVRSSGAVLDTAGVLISSGPEHELKPAVASAKQGNFLLAYSCYTAPSPGSAAFRIVGNIWRVGEGLAAVWPYITNIEDVPGDQGGWARVFFTRSGLDDVGETTYPIVGYNIHRRIDDPVFARRIVDEGKPVSAERGAEPSESAVNAVSVEPTPFVPLGENVEALCLDGHYFVVTEIPPGVWEVVGTVFAQQQDVYVCLAPTVGDSAATIPYSVYCVSAHTTTPSVYYWSPPDSGYSVDNVSPVPPSGLAGNYSYPPAELLITWDANTEHDLSHYAVYKGDHEGFVPGAANRIGTPEGTSFVDASFDPNVDNYYKVSALDIHGNESAHALIGPQDITGASDVPSAPSVSHLEQNVPNPFNPVTVIRFAVAEAGYVKLVVHDVAGRPVRTLVEGRREAKGYEVSWDGRDDQGAMMASGVYVYELEVPGYREAKKMVLLK